MVVLPATRQFCFQGKKCITHLFNLSEHLVSIYLQFYNNNLIPKSAFKQCTIFCDFHFILKNNLNVNKSLRRFWYFHS